MATNANPIRVQVPLVVEMTAEQAEAWVRVTGLNGGVTATAKMISDDIRAYVLGTVQDSTGLRQGVATVTLKR